MHTLEHIPFMRDLLDRLVPQMNPGAALFFQVPMVRRDYIVPVHYTFFTESACHAMAAELGLDLVGVWYDNALDFLTCILRKPA